ncbi:hypothetical protein ACVWXN_006750 [Bradyrhizobium sp. i1.4.4]
MRLIVAIQPSCSYLDHRRTLCSASGSRSLTHEAVPSTSFSKQYRDEIARILATANGVQIPYDIYSQIAAEERNNVWRAEAATPEVFPQAAIPDACFEEDLPGMRRNTHFANGWVHQGGRPTIRHVVGETKLKLMSTSVFRRGSRRATRE